MLVSLDTSLRGPDAEAYYAYARSLFVDGDLLLINEYQRLDHTIFLTSTGYAAALHNVGTAFWWMPFLALAHAGILLVNGSLGGGVISTDGFNAYYSLWTNFGNWLIGLLALLTTYRFSLRVASRRAVLVATVAIAFGSPFFYYMGFLAPGPGMPAAFVGALSLFTWDAARRRGAWPLWFCCGVLGGTLLTLASYNAIYLILPALSIAELTRRRALPRAILGAAAALATGVCLGFLPQMIAWQFLYGSPFANPYLPQLDWQQPHVAEVLLSTYHGLFFYSPVLFPALLGLRLLWRRDRVFAGGIACMLVMQAYLSGANLGWWGGDSFGMRYFIQLTPVFILCLATLLDLPRPAWLYGVIGACAAWTIALFLGIYSGEASLGEYYRLEQQIALQVATLLNLTRIVREHVLAPRGTLVLWMIVPFTLLTYLVLRFSQRAAGLMRSLSAARSVFAAAMPPLATSALLLAAGARGSVALADARAQPAYAGFARASGDPVDLSYTYSERARYHFRNGNLPAAEADFREAERVFPGNRWTVLFASDQTGMTTRLDWPAGDGIALAGYDAGVPDEQGTVRLVLYWLVSADAVAPFDIQFAWINAQGRPDAGVMATPTQGKRPFTRWKSGDLIRDTHYVRGAPGDALRALELQVSILNSALPGQTVPPRVTRLTVRP